MCSFIPQGLGRVCIISISYIIICNIFFFQALFLWMIIKLYFFLSMLISYNTCLCCPCLEADCVLVLLHLHHYPGLLHDQHLRRFRYRHLPVGGGGGLQELSSRQSNKLWKKKKISLYYYFFLSLIWKLIFDLPKEKISEHSWPIMGGGGCRIKNFR